jgi:hypothetical protein
VLYFVSSSLLIGNRVTGTPGPCVGNIVAIPRLGFPGLCLQDGPLAIRVADYASVFPAGVSTAASFDRELMYDRGVQMGAEFRAKGAHVALGYVFMPLFCSTEFDFWFLAPLLAPLVVPPMLGATGKVSHQTLT